MKKNGAREGRESERYNARVQCLRKITIVYEGQNEQIVVKPPDLSTRGMFINTSRIFPEGAVLNLCFRLALTDAEVRTRSEVRYCLPGVGVGVEFIGIRPEAAKVIEREIELNCGKSSPARQRERAKKRVSKSHGRRRR